MSFGVVLINTIVLDDDIDLNGPLVLVDDILPPCVIKRFKFQSKKDAFSRLGSEARNRLRRRVIKKRGGGRFLSTLMGQPSLSGDHRQCQRMLAALVEMVKAQQSQIETLTEDRKLLEEYIRLQRTSSASHARLLESHISHMKKEEEMVRRVHAGKSNLMAGAKEREALLYKKQLEIAKSDLDDFRDCVESLGAEIVELKESINCRSATNERNAGINDLKTVNDPREKDQCFADWAREIRKLKFEHKKVLSKKEADISALIAEKDFVWNQFKKIDKDFTDLVKSKQVEAEQAKGTIDMLQHGLENLQSLVNDKDEAVANLESERDRLEDDIRRRNQEAEQSDEKIKKLQQDVEELRALANQKDEAIAILRSDLAKFDTSSVCTRAKSRFSKDSERQGSLRSGSSALSGSHSRKRSGKSSIATTEGKTTDKRRLLYEGSSGSPAASTGLERCSMLLQTKASPGTVDTPRLFSAKLKVPKLKNHSSISS